MEQKVTTVIPTLNEGATIGNVVKECKKYGKVLVVDGCSTDKTWEIAKKAGAKVIIERKRGYGQAYLTGFRKLDKNTEIVVMIDGDSTYPAEKIPLLIKNLKDCDIVIGSRLSGNIKESMPFLSRTGNRIVTWIFNKLYKLDVQDTQSGFRAIKRDALNKMFLTQTGMSFALEMLVETLKNNLIVKEVPINYSSRTSGKTKLNPLYDGIKIVKTTFWLLRDYSPLKFFGIISIINLFIGFVIGLKTFLVWYYSGGKVLHIGLAVLSSLFILIGLLMFFTGLISDTMKQIFERSMRHG